MKLNNKGSITLDTLLFLIIGIPMILILLCMFGLRLDFAKGSHRIMPTAVDTDFWGNYKVYYKTSAYTQNSQEDYYYIDKNSEELAKKMQEYVITGDEVIVYYDKYVGWKGISAPATSPIIRIEEVQ